MKMFLTAFGLHNPFSASQLQSHGLIPIATDANGGLDLDYSALMIAESFIIDRTAYDYIRDQRKTFLGPMYNSLEVLEVEGLLEIVDYAEPLLKYSQQVEIKTLQLVQSVDMWRETARTQWQEVKDEFLEFGTLYSPPDKREFDSAHYGVVSYLERRDGRIQYSEVTRLHELIEGQRKRITIAEQEEIKEILKPLIAQVLINDLLRRYYKAPFLDWDDAQDFHDQLHLSQWQDFDAANLPSGHIAELSRCLFNTIIPELLPGQIEDVVKFLNNRKAVRSLREELWNTLNTGEAISKDWMLRLHQEAIKAELQIEKRARIIKWIGRAAGLLIPGIGAVGDLVIMAAEDSAEHFSELGIHKKFEWYYVLQQMKIS